MRQVELYWIINSRSSRSSRAGKFNFLFVLNEVDLESRPLLVKKEEEDNGDERENQNLCSIGLRLNIIASGPL